MDNRVGNEILTVEQAIALLAQLKAIRTDLEKFTVKLTNSERRRLASFQPGGEVIVQLVGDLAEKYGVTLPDMPVAGMRDDLTLAQRLAPLVSEAALLLGWLQDTTAQARSEAWQAATGNYTVLNRVSAANPSLAKELTPARAFFARRYGSKPAEGGAERPRLRRGGKRKAPAAPAEAPAEAPSES